MNELVDLSLQAYIEDIIRTLLQLCQLDIQNSSEHFSTLVAYVKSALQRPQVS